MEIDFTFEDKLSSTRLSGNNSNLSYYNNFLIYISTNSVRFRLLRNS